MAAGTTTLDWVKTLLPVATFVAGFWLSAWQRRSQDAKARRNMRSILRKELLADLRTVARVRAPAADAEAPLRDPLLVMRALLALSTTVYEQYLGRLDSLGADELDAVYDAYA